MSATYHGDLKSGNSRTSSQDVAKLKESLFRKVTTVDSKASALFNLHQKKVLERRKNSREKSLMVERLELELQRLIEIEVRESATIETIGIEIDNHRVKKQINIL